ncbi:MAG: hypothetical protein WEE89_20620 [Gemmatimonadota bacterium]
MRRGFGVIAIVTMFASGSLSQANAQEPRLVGRLADAARVQVDGILVTARAAGLPAEPLVDRALQGATMGAPPDRIVAAVNRLLEELRVARQAFGETASAAELTAGAEALRAGASKADLARLKQLRPRHSLTIAAGVLADLVAAGVAADTGIAAVLALASNAGDADYIAFRRNVERDIAQGASPASSIGVRLRAVGEMADAPRDLTTGSTSTTAPPRKRKP